MFGFRIWRGQVRKPQNLLKYSQQFQQGAVWLPTGLTSVTADAEVAPDGTTTAETLTENTAGGTHIVSQSMVGVLTAGQVYNLSAYWKAGTAARVAIGGNGGAVHAFFNLATGAVGTQVGSPSAVIVPAANGFYRCSITFTFTAGTSVNLYMAWASGDAVSYTGTSRTVHVWGAQIVQGASMKPYVETQASVIP